MVATGTYQVISENFDRWNPAHAHLWAKRGVRGSACGGGWYLAIRYVVVQLRGCRLTFVSIFVHG